MYLRLITIGFAIWLLATLTLRLAGRRILSVDHSAYAMLLFLASFVLVGLLVRRVCKGTKLPPEQWLAGAVLLLLPTLLLDPFSSAFFPIVFPNIPPSAAGVFGGWMIICCAGGLVGVLGPSLKRS